MKLEPWQHHHTLLDSVLHPGESLQFRISSLEANKSTRKSQEYIIPSPQENVVHFSSEPIQIPQPAVRRRLLFGQSSYDEPSLDSGVFSPSSWKPEMQQITPEDDDVFESEFGNYERTVFVFDETPTTPHNHFFQWSLSRAHSLEQGHHPYLIQSNTSRDRMSAIPDLTTSSTIKMSNGEQRDKTLPLQIQRQRASSLHSQGSVSQNLPNMESTNSCHSVYSYNKERAFTNQTLYTFGTPMIEEGISAREIIVSTTHEKERRSK